MENQEELVESLKKNFSQNLKYYMTIRGVSQADIARAVDISRSNVSRWISGQYLPSAATLAVVADYLHVPQSTMLSKFEGCDEQIDEQYLKIARKLQSMHLTDAQLKKVEAFIEILL